MKKALIIVAILIVPFLTKAQEGDDKLIKELTSNLTSETRSERMVEIGKRFLGKPYLGHTLESTTEKLICRLDGFDCYTYVETLLALTHISEYENPTLADFREMMQRLRYRYGEVDGYSSRIHYFFDWTKHAEDMGLVEDLTPELGTKKPLNINFMSTHRQYYSAFKTNNTVLGQIKVMEADLADYDFYEIKPENLDQVKGEIKTGDIIAFTSNIKGLDVNHEGIAYWQNGELRFMHASSELEKVVIADETIKNYINRISKHAGLMVVRVL
ncbi:N-acetylmuramoyl-L-alanine amidase-like domain-containing protein [Jiulongibacter sediminis]|uniref:N-acetylmuramoyl-L-alanine amidase-like domain-containing protein n=1 Tax=Jiulongibacter sediminis TaxID=1605367 RepID=UPI0006DC4649|nr:N-acetylmuramoyl-L-alanine amidase-like domain-containing protein [Jiulongibacter sediminis]